MNNFFTNLVTRSLAPAPNVLQPKLPSLFEEPLDSEPTLEELVSFRTREETMAPTPSPLTSQPTEQPRVHEPFTEPRLETRTLRRTILPIVPIVPEEPPHAPLLIQSQRQPVTAAAPKAETDSEERKHVIVSRVEEAAQPAVEKKQSIAIQESMPRLVPALPRLESSRPIPQPEKNTNTNLFSPEEISPTVRIHIGRIEVRAVTQSAPPARAVPSNRPKLTLDEYLLRRNEGKR